MGNDLKFKIKAFDRATKTINKVSLAITKINRATKGANVGFSKMDKRLRKIGFAAQKLGKKMKAIGGGLTKKLTLPIGAFAGFAVKKFADVEQGFINVRKTTGLALKDIEKSIFGISKRIPVSIDMLNEIAGAAGQLGVKGRENIEKFTETFAKLQGASDISGEAGAKSVTRILTVTGEGVKQIDRFSSAIVELGNNYAASESEILGVANRVAGATGRFNLGSANVLGISTALKALGKNAESSGTVVGRTFNGIDQALRNGGKALKQLEIITGKSASVIRKEFGEDATNVFKQVVDGLNRMQGEGLNTVKALDNMGIKGERVNDVLGTLVNKNEKLGEALESANRAYQENTALNKEFEEQTKSLNAAMTRFKNTIDRLRTRIGRKLAPAVTWVMEKFSNFFDFLEANPALENALIIFGTFLAVIGPIIFAVGSLVAAFGSLLIVKTIMGVLGISMGAVLLLMGKFILIGALIAGAAFLIYKAWNPVKNFFVNLWNEPIEVLKSFLDLASKIIPFGRLGKLAVNKIIEFAGGGKDALNNRKDFSLFGENVGARKVKEQSDNREFVTRTNNARVSLGFKNAPDNFVVKPEKGSESFLDINNGLLGAL